MMGYTFISILKNEMASFMNILKLSALATETFMKYQSTLCNFDSFLHAQGLTVKKLGAEQVKRWLDGFYVSAATKNNKLSRIRRFSRHLATLGITAALPEMPRKTHDYAPYAFTMDEMDRIFEAADDLLLYYSHSRKAAEFPVLLRLLYGCGLRIGEAIALTWNDINLSAGVITVKTGKNRKQRIVPMCDELARILTLYRAAPCSNAQNCAPLFKHNDGRARSATAYWKMFHLILCELGIKNAQTAKCRSPGPCIHSLRHTFTLHSLLKAETEGREFMDTVPFLSTYLGHAGLMETDKYLQARYELYINAHAVMENYTRDVFPEDENDGV